MKKIFKVFGARLAFAMVIGLCSCDGLFPQGGDAQDEEVAKKYEKANGDAINHEFYLSDNKGQYVYYTSTQRFKYGNHEDCIYQVNFTTKDSAGTKGDWKLYTRERGSTKTIEMIYKGTFKGVSNGSVTTGGKVELYISEDLYDTVDIEQKTVALTSGDKEAYAFTTNVAAAHAVINAEDVK